ncbi:hypothetical protein Pcinc_000391 [Petrolisthes cinctipes]|uniref:Uncharacterized protein n=1 Tax=Petrolisthes cinctipes TaxID=88211 RepID=A0AAE1GM98_PETCI|nr:hypothetical protein Pcinc_000391 [Petrolisthes cinctipes]
MSVGGVVIRVHFKRTAVSVSSSSRSSSSSSSTYSSSSRSSSSSSSSISRQRSPGTKTINSVGVIKEEPRNPLPLQRQLEPRNPLSVHRQLDPPTPLPLQRQQEPRSPLPLPKQQEPRNPLPLQRQQESRSPLQLPRQQDPSNPLPLQRQQEPRRPLPLLRQQGSRSPLPLPRQQEPRSSLTGQQKFRSKIPKQQKFRSTLRGHLELPQTPVSKQPKPKPRTLLPFQPQVPVPKQEDVPRRSPHAESLLSHSSSQSPLSLHSPSFSPYSIVEDSLPRFSLSHGPQYSTSSITRRERGRKVERKKSIVTEAKQGTRRRQADSERGRRGRGGWGEDRKRVKGGKEESRERKTFATPAPQANTRSTSEPFSTPVSTNVPEMFLTPAPHPTKSYTAVSMPLSLQALVPLDPSTAPSSLAPLFLASHLASQITTMKTGLDHGQDWISLRSSPLLDEPQTNQYSTYGQIRLNPKENRGHRIKFTSGVNQSHQVHDRARTNTTQIQMGSGIQIRVQGMSPRPIIPPSTKKNVVQDELPQQQQQLLQTLQQQNELILHDHGGILYNVQFWPRGGSESRSSQTNKHNNEGKADGGKVGGDKGHTNNNERETETSTRSKEVIIITGKKVLESYVPSSLPTSSSSPSKKAQRRKVVVERRLGSSKSNISTLHPWKTILTSQPQGKIPISQPQRSQTLTLQPQRKKTSTSQPDNQTSTSQEQLQNSTSSFPPSKTITRRKGEGNSMKGRNRGLRRYKKHLPHRPLHVLHGPPYDHYKHSRASLSPGGTFSSILPPSPLRRQKAYRHYNTVTNKPQDERYLVSGKLKSEPLLPTLPVPPSFGNQMAYQDYHNNYHALKVKADVDESLFASENLKSNLKPTISLQPYFSEESPHKHQHSHRRHSFPSTAPPLPRTTHFSKPTLSPRIKLPPSPLSPPIPRTTTLSPVRLSPTKRPSLRFLPTTLPPQLTTSTMLRIKPYRPPQLPTSPPPPRIIPHLTPLPTHPTSQPPPPPRIQHPTSRRPTSIPTRLLHPSSHPTSLPPRLIRHPTSLPPHLTPLPRLPHIPSSPPLDLPPLLYPTSLLPPLPYPTSTLPPLLHLTSTFPPLPYPISTIPPRPPPSNPEPDSLGSSVIGKAWMDYPAYATIPRTNFTCTGPGLYADTQAGCQPATTTTSSDRCCLKKAIEYPTIKFLREYINNPMVKWTGCMPTGKQKGDQSLNMEDQNQY